VDRRVRVARRFADVLREHGRNLGAGPACDFDELALIERVRSGLAHEPLVVRLE
jgi:hypothetical protein